MFDLDEAVANWRRQMLAAGIKTPVPLDELEGHLRDDVERQLHEGLSEQRAFEIAVGRIGQASSLKMEFKKVNGADKSQRRKRADLFFFVVLGFYSLGITWVLCRNDLPFNERLLDFASLATMLLSVYVVRRFTPRFLSVIPSKRFKTAAVIAGSISGMSWLLAFAYFILPRSVVTPGQFTVVVLWAFVPAVPLTAFSFLGIDKSEC